MFRRLTTATGVELCRLSELYESLLKQVAADSPGYAGEFYSPRHIIAADNLREESDDEPSAVNIFEAVRDDLVDEIRIDQPALRQLYSWAASGCLFAKVWEQYVRLYPEQEPWPGDTEAARWRSLEG